MIPTILTDRIILRPPQIEDADPYIAVLTSERAKHIGGPMEDYDAWLDFCMEIASWHLRGYGAFAMEERKTGRFLGLSILHHDRGDPERELGWVITEDAEGHGFAYEAAFATRRYAYDDLGWTTVVSYIDPANTRSAKLAEKLGARLDPEAAQVAGYPDCLIYRHPAPSELVQ